MLFQSLLKISSITILSRLLGFVRDVLQAMYFGSNALTDAFNIAFRIPNLLRRVFAEGAFSQAFVPILLKRKHDKAFIASVFGALIVALIVVTALGLIFATYIIKTSAPGFSPAQATLATSLLHITFPYILFISLASFFAGILNSYQIFALPAFVPVILNICFIIFMICRNWFTIPIYALAYSVLIGGILQFAIQLPALYKKKYLPVPSLKLKDGAIQLAKKMVPAVFAVSISQLSMLINTIYGSYLTAGSISWVYYADRLMELPTGVFGVAIGTLLLTNLSKNANNKEEFSRLIDWGLKLSLLFALPASLFLMITSQLLTRVLFMHGAFTNYDAIMTGNAVFGYGIGLVGIIVVKVLAPGFYAHQNIYTPVKIAVFTLIINQLLNLLLIHHLQHVALTLSISISAVINAVILYVQLVRHKIYRPKLKVLKLLMQMLFGLIAMSIEMFLINYLLTGILALIVIVITAPLIYFASLWAFGIRMSQADI